MCGIVGLFIKDAKLEPKLGELTSTMLTTMCERGPDSAGFAVYGPAAKGISKITLQSPNPERDFAGLTAAISKAIGADVSLERKSTHAVMSVPADKAQVAREALRAGVKVGTPAQVHVEGTDRVWSGTVRMVRSDPTFTPYYALTGQDVSRLSYLAEVQLGDDARELPAGLPLWVEFTP